MCANIFPHMLQGMQAPFLFGAIGSSIVSIRCPDMVAEAAVGGDGKLKLVVVDDVVVEVRGQSSDSFSSSSMEVVETQKLLVC